MQNSFMSRKKKSAHNNGAVVYVCFNIKIMSLKKIKKL